VSERRKAQGAGREAQGGRGIAELSFTGTRIIERVISAADAEHPADRLLREELKSVKSLSARETTEISQTVFAYYRWFGWLDEGDSLTTRLGRARELDTRFRDDPGSFRDDEMIERAVPKWISAEIKVTAKWARSLQKEPAVWLRAQSARREAQGAGREEQSAGRKAQGEEVRMALGDCRPLGDGPLANTLEYRGKKDLFLTPEFHAGLFEIQDVNSQMVSLVCAPRPGETWWDACAGEGGKLLHLSDLMNNKGLIWASDRAEWRLKNLKRRAARAGVFNYRTVPWDGGSRRPTKTHFDGVLVDAPCSGVGTWQRNPHARWTLRPQDVSELAALQTNILAHAAPAMKPGGKLIYAVCTLTRSETAEVAERFSRDHPRFKPLPFRNPVNGRDCAAGQYIFDPAEHRGNGMFVAAWRLDLAAGSV